MISDSSLDALRNVEPSEAVSALGLERGAVRQAGGFLVCCPAHGDRTPSCSITRGQDGTIRVRCFGCDLAGDVFHLVAAVERLDARSDFAAVARRAAEIFGVGIDGAARPPRQRTSAPEPERLDVATFAAIVRPLAHIGRLDGRGLSTQATEYLSRRSLLEEAATDGWFALGPSCGAMLSDVFGVALLKLKQTGLFDARGQLSDPSHLLGIPWRDPDGRIDTIQRRRLDGSSERKYLFPRSRGALHCYGIEKLRAAKAESEIVLTEGALDVLARRRAVRDGRVVLGCAGVSWKPADGWKIAKGRVVRIAFDADTAGDTASERLAESLYQAGAVRVLRERPRGANDWADLITNRQDAA